MEVYISNLFYTGIILLACSFLCTCYWLIKKYTSNSSFRTIRKLWHLALLHMICLPAISFAIVQNKLNIQLEPKQYEFIATSVLSCIIFYFFFKSLSYLVPSIIAKVNKQDISPSILGIAILIITIPLNILAWLIIKKNL